MKILTLPRLLIIVFVLLVIILGLWRTNVTGRSENKSVEQIPTGEPQRKKIELIPLTLREGLMSQFSATLRKELAGQSSRSPDEVMDEVSETKAFQVFHQDYTDAANELGLDLVNYLDKRYVAACNNNLLVLFYNLARAHGCDREYVIQRVKIEKSYYDKHGKTYDTKYYYLVEVIKLNERKEIKKADRHFHEYGLGNAYGRKTIVEIEIGCGEIPGAVEGQKWPFSRKIMFHMLQDYSEEPRYYEKVYFDFSKTYRVVFEFDRDGNFYVDLPYFLRH